MTGQNDQGCSPEHNKKMFKELENSKLVILPKVKHSILIEEPSETVKNILDFISNI
jgi:pimeloyl-ACP methyl ester carboxylesterase